MRVTGDQIIPAMLYSARTDASVPWGMFADAISSAPLLTPRERCEALLRAVNGEALAIKEWDGLVGAPIQPSLPPNAAVPLVDAALPALRGALDRIIEDPDTATAEISANVANILNGEVVTFPEFAVVDGDWTKQERVVASSIGPALIYALSLVLDPRLEFGRLLRRCQLDECSRFAFGEEPRTPGQPPNFYCNNDHRDLHKRAQTRERVAASRAGVSVATWRRKHK